VCRQNPRNFAVKVFEEFPRSFEPVADGAPGSVDVSVVELPPPSCLVRIVQSVNPSPAGIVQRQGIFDAVRPTLAGFDSPRCNLDPIAGAEPKFRSIEAEQEFQLMIYIDL